MKTIEEIRAKIEVLSQVPTLPGTQRFHYSTVAVLKDVVDLIDTQLAESEASAAQLASVTKERDAVLDSQHVLGEAVEDLTAQLAEANRKLAPSPCGKGHRMVDWVEHVALTDTVNERGFQTVVDEPAHCLACRECEQIAAAECERCALIFESLHDVASARLIREAGPPLAIDEIRREARDAALVEAAKAICVNCSECGPPARYGDVWKHPRGMDALCHCYAHGIYELRAKAKGGEFGPTLAIDEIRREAKIEGMLKVHNIAMHEYGDGDTSDCMICSLIQVEKMELASLRAKEGGR